VTAGKHFNELLERYGSPVVVINLVKKRETRRHETLLSEEFTKQGPCTTHHVGEGGEKEK
jgi:hypothetical protein